MIVQVARLDRRSGVNSSSPGLLLSPGSGLRSIMARTIVLIFLLAVAHPAAQAPALPQVIAPFPKGLTGTLVRVEMLPIGMVLDCPTVRVRIGIYAMRSRHAACHEVPPPSC